MSVKESFEDQFGGLLSGTLDMFTFAETKETEGMPETDVDAIYKAEQKVEEFHKRGKDVVDTAREEVRALARTYKAAENQTARAPGQASSAEHEAMMAQAQQTLLAGLKNNKQMEQAVYRYQADLARLQQENRDEEADAVEVSELNSEVLRLKMYREMGFTPQEQDGSFSKMLIRTRKSREARTVMVDSTNSNFFWSNFLWDTVSA